MWSLYLQIEPGVRREALGQRRRSVCVCMDRVVYVANISAKGSDRKSKITQNIQKHPSP